MKIYHKFLLYQNKWIHPYVRMTVGVMTSITYLASILLIVGVVYEHGFTISEVEAHQLQRLYHGVWIVFLVDVTLRILLEYKDTRRTFSKLTWILTILLYLTLIPVIFHRPEEEGAILQFWEFLHGKAYHLVLLLVFSFFSLSFMRKQLLLCQKKNRTSSLYPAFGADFPDWQHLYDLPGTSVWWKRNHSHDCSWRCAF